MKGVSMHVAIEWRTATPESEGIRSEALLAFLDAVEREHLELHSLLLLRNEKLLLNCFWKPFGLDKLQRICSAGKTLVAAAVLFAVEEDLFSLQDHVLELLPEAAEYADKAAAGMTVYNLLTMHAGHREDSYVKMHAADDPIAAFFREPFVDKPGTHFFYDNGIPDILAEIIFRKTGHRVSSYLAPRLFEPLGISEVRIESRGARDDLPTFCLRTVDFLKISLFFAKAGQWNGKQLLQADIVKAACAWQVPTSNCKEMIDIPEFPTQPGSGYGFQIWRNHFGGFTLNGGAGQLGIVLPEQNIVVAIHGNEPRSDRIMKLLWKYLSSNMFAYPIPESPKSYARLLEKSEHLNLCGRDEAQPAMDFGGHFVLPETFFGINKLSFSPLSRETRLEFWTEHERQVLLLPPNGKWVSCHIPLRFMEMQSPSEHRIMDHGIRLDTNVGYDTKEGYAAGRWASPYRYELWFRSDAWMGSNILTLDFTCTNSLILEQENGIAHNLRCSPTDVVNEHWRSCIHANYIRAKRI